MSTGTSRSSDGAGAPEDSGNRLPPNVIHRPLWPSATKDAPVLLLLICFPVVGIVLAAYLIDSPGGALGYVFAGSAILVSLIVGGLLAGLLLSRRQCGPSVEQVIRADLRPALHPSVNTLFGKWLRPRDPPKGVFEALLDPQTGIGVRAQIVCLGGDQIPAGDDLRFEPIIITPWIKMRRNIPLWVLVGWLTAIAVLCALALALYFQVGLSNVVIGTAAAAIFNGAMLLQPLIRPRHIRLAPGVVQFLQFGFFHGRPRIQSFEMTAGTIAVLTRNMSADLMLIRDKNVMRTSIRGFEHEVWRCLLSTAPIPSMSETELVG